jgi:hypothetical protein
MSNKEKYAKCKYLIYSCFTTKLKYGGSISGSHYYNLYPNTEEEAKEMLAIAQKKSEEFYTIFGGKDTTYRYGYHLNNPDWWSR